MTGEEMELTDEDKLTDEELVEVLRNGLSEFPDWEDAADRIEALTAERDAMVGALENLNDEVELLGVLLSGLEPKRQEALEKGASPKNYGESLWAFTMRMRIILTRIKEGKL